MGGGINGVPISISLSSINYALHHGDIIESYRYKSAKIKVIQLRAFSKEEPKHKG
jgi:hypothetical protein